MIVTADHSRQLRDDGYTVFAGVIPATAVDGLRQECARGLALQIADMNAVGAEVLGLSRKQQRHFLPVRHDGNPILTGFLFGDLVMDIVAAAVGRNAWFFLELFVTKEPRTGGNFGWHQDSGYLLETAHRPYVTLWCALDDITEQNGALRVLSGSRAPSRDVVRHAKDKATHDLIGYDGTDPGLALPVSQGSIVVLSSTTFHCSGPNSTNAQRRAYLASFSSEPIKDGTGKLWNRAVPCLADGVRVPAAERERE